MFSNRSNLWIELKWNEWCSCCWILNTDHLNGIIFIYVKFLYTSLAYQLQTSWLNSTFRKIKCSLLLLFLPFFDFSSKTWLNHNARPNLLRRSLRIKSQQPKQHDDDTGDTNFTPPYQRTLPPFTPFHWRDEVGRFILAPSFKSSSWWYVILKAKRF